ncbi:MAG: ATP-binding protein [Candidatus Sumerlaeota bacterium]|nr:ATP-binding protein [Candidatus Sumerlaeota bacterium]
MPIPTPKTKSQQLRDLKALRTRIARLEALHDQDRKTVEEVQEHARQCLRLVSEMPGENTGQKKARPHDSGSPGKDAVRSLALLGKNLDLTKRQYERIVRKRTAEHRELEALCDRFQQTLQQERDLSGVVLETTASLVAVLDSEGRLVRYNKAFEKTFAGPANALRRKRFWDLGLESHRETSIESFIREQMNPSRRGAKLETRRIAGDQEDAWIVWTVSLLRDEEDAASFLVLAGHDVTELKRREFEARKWHRELEGKVQERTAKLDRINQDLECLIYALSHDLRAPLRAIRNYADFLKIGLADAIQGESAEDLNRLCRSAAEMDSMLQELLEYARIDRSRHHAESIDLNELADDVARALAAQPDAEVRIENPLPTIQAPRVLTCHVFENLIANGLTYNKSTPRQVKIFCQPATAPKDCWRITFQDNGIGIEPQHHEKVFLMFQRLHTDKEYPGSGIGLASVKKALEVLGGSIELESELGKGSSFHVCLPQTWEERSPDP